MSEPLWLGLGSVAVIGALALWSATSRISRARAIVLDDVRRALRGGVIENQRGRGPQARGRLGELEVTVDLGPDSSRRSQSPMWRILAVGPVRLDRPIEARVGGWQGWIDPRLHLGETLEVPGGNGHAALTAHAEQMPTTDHPVVRALERQGGLPPGALHARTDLMRAEVRFSRRAGQNQGLLSYLQAMQEISEARSQRAAHRRLGSPARVRRVEVAVREGH